MRCSMNALMFETMERKRNRVYQNKLLIHLPQEGKNLHANGCESSIEGTLWTGVILHYTWGVVLDSVYHLTWCMASSFGSTKENWPTIYHVNHSFHHVTVVTTVTFTAMWYKVAIQQIGTKTSKI